ncbi:MAG: sigma-70 family RNA polymerase sigma factor [Actinomycetota bacterium]|nr:sigma-70 family RNA polymerase sigma factor [Actinomycetota bacterium]
MLASSAAAARHYGAGTSEEHPDDAEGRNGTVVAYQGLAYSLAARFAQRGEELDDLNQVAMIGLVKAVDRFDPDRGVALTTFASVTILGELKRHLRDRSWSVRLPRRVHDLHLRVQQSIDQLSQDLGRSPAISEIAADLGATIEEVVEALDAGGLRHNAPLEVPSPTGADSHGVGTRMGHPDGNLAEVDSRVSLSPLLKRLPDRQREVLALRFGNGCSQSEIARRIGISQMQVSRLLSKSLAQLRTWTAEVS